MMVLVAQLACSMSAESPDARACAARARTLSVRACAQPGSSLQETQETLRRKEPLQCGPPFTAHMHTEHLWCTLT